MLINVTMLRQMTRTSTKKFLTFCPPQHICSQVKYTLEKIVSIFQLSHLGGRKVGYRYWSNNSVDDKEQKKQDQKDNRNNQPNFHQQEQILRSCICFTSFAHRKNNNRRTWHGSTNKMSWRWFIKLTDNQPNKSTIRWCPKKTEEMLI